MSDENQPEKPQIEIAGDDDWKERVKAEDAKLDAASQSTTDDESGDSEEKPEIDPSQIPPASFTMLVQMFSTQAMVALGAIPAPDGKQTQQLGLAKHFIDLLGVLEEKCQGNMTDDEKHLLEQSLHELRMAYVQLTSGSTAGS